uniref:Ig-like domain-containing protein n=1 Tax=Heterorhabditis bacteriophora TaxID=37862 RepID=A0A1I7XG39_HETBA
MVDNENQSYVDADRDARHMKTILQCDIDENFSVLVLLSESHNGSNQAGRIKIIDNCSLLTKFVKSERVIVLLVYFCYSICNFRDKICFFPLNYVTMLLIFFLMSKIRAIRHLSFRNNNYSEVTKKFKSFSANPKPINDHSSILIAVKAVLENPENTKKWRTLRKKLSTSSGNLNGVLSLTDQTALLETLKQGCGAEELVELCTVLKNTNVFGFKCQESFINFCFDMKLDSIIDSFLDSPNALSEAVLSKFLKIATTKTINEGKSMLESILCRGFSDRFMAENAVNILTSDEAALVIEWCAHIYQDQEKENISEQALSLISVLIDTHGNRFIWDNDSHDKILNVITLVTDLNTSFSLHIQTEASLLKSSTIIPSLSSKSAILTEKFEEKVGESPEVYIKECGKTSSDYINVELPRSELYLCGYSSIKENVSYRWFRVDKLSSELPIDVTGSTTTNLTLTNIQSNELVGPYQFRLDVSGPKGRNASKSIKIYVIKANDLHPVVDAGGNYTVLMPENSVQLKGKVGNSNNSSFQWIQIDGPSKVSILNSDRVNATIGDLREGLYHMQLTVTGAKNSSNSADAFINVQKSVISYDWRPLDNVPASLVRFIPTNLFLLN